MTIERVSSNQLLGFTPDQDQQLRSHFNAHRSTHWQLVADSVHRTAVACSQRFWSRLATPEEIENRFRVKLFSSEDKAALRAHFNIYGSKKWEIIAKTLKKSSNSCYVHFWRFIATPEELKTKKIYQNFTDEDEATLRAHFNKYGSSNWQLVANVLEQPIMTCITYFWTVVATTEEKTKRASKRRFTNNEKLALRAHFTEHGSSNWHLVASSINRAVDSCSSYFWRYIATDKEKTERIKSGKFTNNEKLALRVHVNTHGPKDWNIVANSINRPARSCSKYFWEFVATDAEKSTRTKPKEFTVAEMIALRAHFNTYGPKDWKIVANLINRTVSDCSRLFWRFVATDAEKSTRSKSKEFTVAEKTALRAHFNTHGPKDWKIVANSINRTVSDCSRLFWEFVATDAEKSTRSKPKEFTVAEMTALRAHFNTYGPKNWYLVANSINRTVSDCSTHFWKYVATDAEKAHRANKRSSNANKVPPISNLRYTSNDKAQLRNHFDTHGPQNWHLVANSINRTVGDCSKYFWKFIATDAEKVHRANKRVSNAKKAPPMNNQRFTSDDKAQLRNHFDTYGPQNWHLVGSIINRGARACSTHFWKYVATDAEKVQLPKHKEFTTLEKKALRAHYNKYGARNWAIVANDLDRTPNSCINHFWRSLATPEEKLRRHVIQKFSEDDDTQLRTYVDTYGPKNWRAIATSINKSADSCSKRFWRYLATPEEKKNRRSYKQNPQLQTNANEMNAAAAQLLRLGSDRETIINSHNKRATSTSTNSSRSASSTVAQKRTRTST